MACDTNAVDEGPDNLAAPLFYEVLPAPGTSIALFSKSHRREKEGTVMTYCKAVKHFLETARPMMYLLTPTLI